MHMQHVVCCDTITDHAAVLGCIGIIFDRAAEFERFVHVQNRFCLLQRTVDIVRNHQNGNAALTVEFSQNSVQLMRDNGVKNRCGFV